KVQLNWRFDKRECWPTENFIRVIGNRHVARRGFHSITDGVDPFRATDRDCFPDRGFESSRLDLRLLCCDLETRSAPGRRAWALRRCLADRVPRVHCKRKQHHKMTDAAPDYWAHRCAPLFWPSRCTSCHHTGPTDVTRLTQVSDFFSEA